jgi:hypothetical protein
MHQTYATAPAREKSRAEHAELAEAAKRDRSTFAALYRRYVDRIYRLDAHTKRVYSHPQSDDVSTEQIPPARAS